VSGNEPVSELVANHEHETPAPVQTAPVARETRVDATAPVA
jgi:hypothetical protein